MKINLLKAGLLLVVVLSMITYGTTIAHWNFADSGALDGACMSGNASHVDLDNDGSMDTDDFRVSSIDLTGNGNHLTARTSWLMEWTAASFEGNFAMEATNSYPDVRTDSLYNPTIKGPSYTGIDVETITPKEWTVECVYQATAGANRTIVGRAGYQLHGSKYTNWAPLYLAERLGAAVNIEFVDGAGNHWNALSSGGVVTAGTWYHLAGVSDGSTLILYLKDLDAATDYRTWSVDISRSTDPSLALGYGVWTIACGTYKNRTADHFVSPGKIDSVAISDVALTPDSFVLPVSGHPSENSTIISLVNEANSMINEKKSKKAIKFIEEKLAEYDKQYESNLMEAKRNVRQISELYYSLAKARQAANVSKKEIIFAYKKAVFSRHGTESLIWLYDNSSTDDYQAVAKNLIKDKYIVNIDQFEEAGNWPAFELYLDIVMDETENKLSLAKRLGDGLKKEIWREKYMEYCCQKPYLSGYIIEKIKDAEKQISERKYEKAVEIYRGILLGRVSPEYDTSKIEFGLCKALFLKGDYKEAISKIDRFLRKYKNNKEMTMQAVLMQGQIYIQLGQVDKALGKFLTFMIEYPDSEEAAEANFYVGYCYMLQNKFEKAKKTFELVNEQYPKSLYSGKAKLCLDQIENLMN